VATVDLALAGGGRLAVPATEGVQYTGRYRSVLHFAFAVLPPGQDVDHADLLDGLGRRVGHADGACGCGGGDPRTSTLLSGGNGEARFRLGAGAIPGAHPDACIAVAAGRAPPARCTDYDAGNGDVVALVSCAPRVTVVYGMTRHTVDRVEVKLASGRRVHARVKAFPARLHTSERAFLAVLPGTASVTGIRFPGVRGFQGSDTIPTPLPPAVRQCGYTFHDFM
jgi:hypothetical protein